VRLLFAAVLTSVALLAATKPISLRIIPAEASLRGAKSAQQFLAIAKYADGTERDVTGEAE